MSAFYDQLASLYHLIYPDWNESIERQASQLTGIIEDRVYDMAMYFVVDDRASAQLVTHVMRTQYHAVGTDHLLALMRRAGFTKAERLDGRFYQPVLVGDREA